MKVREIMTGAPKTCTPDTTLAAAANLMWETDCGVLPVVDEGELVGIVTDRDMFIALGPGTRALPMCVWVPWPLPTSRPAGPTTTSKPRWRR